MVEESARGCAFYSITQMHGTTCDNTRVDFATHNLSNAVATCQRHEFTPQVI